MKFNRTALAATVMIGLLLTLPLTACAAEAPTSGDTSGTSRFSDVDPSAWYAEAVNYVSQRGYMLGTGEDQFSPDMTFTRAQMATVLYRLAGEPAVSGEIPFTDAKTDTWYSDALVWASETGIYTGYGDGRFGTNDPVTQEQLVTLLWRLAGKPQAPAGVPDSDASDYAKDAVSWARSVLVDKDGYIFAPKAVALRSLVAVLTAKYDQLPAAEAPGGKTLVAVFSATGHTRPIAECVAETLNADYYEIQPAEPYTSANLNYNDSASRATREQNDASARPAISGTVENMADYDVIFLGYPIWWGQAPKIMYTFVESYDLTGKTIVPFCTSGSSSIGSSAANLSKSASDATWLEGRRFAIGTSDTVVAEWVRGLDLGIQTGKGATSMAGTALQMKINDTPISVQWETNESVDALRELVKETPLTIQMSPYGGFEQVGSLGTTLPRQDVQTTTSAGDIVLYNGSNLVIFYRSNSWAYTRLGKISDMTQDQLRELLGAESVTVKLSLS